MRPLGMVFDGSTSLFETQRVLCTSIGQAIWLAQFTPVHHDHLHFVQALFQAFCSLGICCVFTGLYPAYIAGVLDKSCLEDDFCICHLCIAKSTSTILGTLREKAAKFTIGSFNFQFRSRGAFERYADFSAYDISYEGETLTFYLVLVDATVDCSPRASLNFVEFTWDNIKTFAFIKYAIVCIPLETPKILFLRHYRAANDRWRTFNLCAECCRDSTPTIQQFVNNCAFPPSYFNYPNSCKCNICLRQPPTLHDFASHFVFHLTFILSEFQLTARTLYHHYLHAANSHLLPQHQLIPHTGICFRSAYAHHTVWAREQVPRILHSWPRCFMAFILQRTLC
jgi:hypothetical protein